MTDFSVGKEVVVDEVCYSEFTGACIRESDTDLLCLRVRRRTGYGRG